MENICAQESDPVRITKRTPAKELIVTPKGEKVLDFGQNMAGFVEVKVKGKPGQKIIIRHAETLDKDGNFVTGSFHCSNEMVNQLYSNIQWGRRSNFLDIPTDCPQRDERLGWTGDAQVFCRTASYNMDTARFFSKWLHDMKSGQTKEFGTSMIGWCLAIAAYDPNAAVLTEAARQGNKQR